MIIRLMSVPLRPHAPPHPLIRVRHRSWTRVSEAIQTHLGVAFVVFGLYAILTVMLTWPLAVRLDRGVTSAIDPVSSIWRLGWAQQQLLHHPLHLFDGNIFYPYQRTYLFDGLELGAAILTLPLAIVGLPPLAIYNLGVLLSISLGGSAMFLLARRFGATPIAAFIAGGIYAFAPMQIDRIGHIAFLSTAWFPLILLLMDRQIAQPRPRDTLALACCLIMAALSTQYYAFYLAFLVPLFLGIMLLRRAETRRRIVWMHLLAAGGVALAVVAPFAIAYRQIQVQYGVERSYGQVTYYSATLANFITADGRNLVWGSLTSHLRSSGAYTFERNMFPGLVALALALVGAWAGRKRAWEQFLAALAVTGAALAVGPELRLTPASKLPLARHLPYDIFYWHVPGFDSMRSPGRFGVLFLLGIAGLAATGATTLLRWFASRDAPRMPRTHAMPIPIPIIVSGLMLVGIAVEYANAPLAIVPLESGAAIPAEYRWLATQPDARIIELPLLIPDHAREQQIAAREQYFSLSHGHPLVNGNANVIPKGYKALVLDMQRFPSPRTMTILQGLGITDVVVHLDQFTDAQRADMERHLAEGWDGLSLAMSFDATRVYHLAPSQQLAQLHALIPPGASIALSREDPQGTGAYMAMLGYVLRDHPLYAHLGVEFGEVYLGSPIAGQQYDYVVLYRGEDATAMGMSEQQLIWQDSVARVYRSRPP